ncbi:MAG: complex I NDUFA9 subunit family protein [Lautropia sp.]
MIRILVTGGSGFIGSRLVPLLDAAGCAVTVPTRRRERARHLLVLPQADVVEADIHDDATLARLVDRADAVVNLVGILHGRGGRAAGDEYDVGPDFMKAHVRLAERLVAAAADRPRGTGGPPRRLVQVSALGVDVDDVARLPSRYLRSKAVAERIVRASPLDWTILRPSVVFGEGDSFLSLFATLQRFLPVLALASTQARFQPVYVGDLACAIRNCLIGPYALQTRGRSFEVAGPTVHTLEQLIRLAGSASGHPRRVFTLPDGLGRLQAALMERLPGATLMSRDNLDSMKVDNVASGPIDPLLDIDPVSLERIAPGYLAPGDSPYNAERRRAGR